MAAVAVAVAMLLAVVAAVTWRPVFYTERLAPSAAAEPASRRLITKVAGLQAVATRDGPWEAAIREEEINAWLAVDLPRNHASLLPLGMAAPRVRLEGEAVDAAVRLGAGAVSTVVSCSARVRLLESNQVEIGITAARLGALPLPRSAVLHRLAAALEAAGLVTERRFPDGRPVLVVSLPRRAGRDGRWLEVRALGIEAGELLVAGETKERR